MARNIKQPFQSKKHLARLERERIQRRYITIGSIAIAVLVVLIIGYGILEQTVLTGMRPVAIVNGESILTRDWQPQVRYQRNSLINQAYQTMQLGQMFSGSPEMMASIQSQLTQIQAMLSPEVVGQQAVDQMIDATLIRQEAVRFCYGRKWTLVTMKSTTIRLPITASGEPDWDLIESYMMTLRWSQALTR